MESRERWIARRELREAGHEPLRHAGRARIEIQARGAHAVVGAIGLGHLEVGVVEQRATAAVGQHRIAAELRHDRRRAVLRQREHVHPGVDADSRRARALEQQRERVDARAVAHLPVRRRVGERAVVPCAAAAVHLHEQIGRAQRGRIADQLGYARGIVEHAPGTLREHPQRAMRHRGGLRGGRFGLARVRRLAVAPTASQARHDRECERRAAAGRSSHGRGTYPSGSHETTRERSTRASGRTMRGPTTPA